MKGGSIAEGCRGFGSRVCIAISAASCLCLAWFYHLCCPNAALCWALKKMETELDHQRRGFGKAEQVYTVQFTAGQPAVVTTAEAASEQGSLTLAPWLKWADGDILPVQRDSVHPCWLEEPGWRNRNCAGSWTLGGYLKIERNSIKMVVCSNSPIQTPLPGRWWLGYTCKRSFGLEAVLCLYFSSWLY